MAAEATEANVRADGLDPDEGRVMDCLVDAVEAYGRLPFQHPNEADEFVTAIHRAQDLLAVRIARRYFPEGWPTYGESDL